MASAAVGVKPTLYVMTALGVTAALAIASVPAVRRLPRAEPVADPAPA